MERVSRESPSTRASSFSPRETYSATKGPHRKKVRPFIYRGSHSRKLLMLQSPCVCRRSSAVTENSASLGQGHPFQTVFWPWAVRPTGSGREGRSRASCSESSAGPPVMTEADGNLRACTVLPSAAPIASMCEPILVFPLPPEPPTCPARPSAAPAYTRCEPFPSNRLTPAACGSGSCPALWQQEHGNRQPPAMLLC